VESHKAKPKVSVIVPCFNLGQYLDETVDSVLEQTFQDFEILIVDDGSTDHATCDLFDEYNRPKTRVFRIPNQGVSGARNFGVERSDGEYLCFLDADDKLDPLFLEKTIAPLERDPSLGFVSCWLRMFGNEDWTWRQERCDLPAVLAECTVLTAAPVRRRVVEDVGGFDPGLGQLFAEDWDLWISILEKGHRGIILPEVLFYYRRYAGSNSRRWEDPQFVARVTKALVERHPTSYRQHLFEVLLLKERRIGELLKANYDFQTEVESQSFSIACQQTQVELLNRRISSVQAAAGADSAGSTLTFAEPVIGDQARTITWGDLDRTAPLSSIWGFDRGNPVDRYYIQTFLSSNAADIRGDVLEVGDTGHTQRFGGDSVRSMSVIDINPGNPAATFVTDLRNAASIPSASFDCFIMTQTAYLIDDIRSVLAECARILRPGGKLLATLPCAIRLEPVTGLDNDFWRLGPRAAKVFFSQFFPAENVTVKTYGNLLTTTAFLYGLAHEELTIDELEISDPRYPLTLGIRAVARQVAVENAG
jgi:glycosyltransferase involved in cell wall biosynthesis/SAM-dependent methyltransferase